MALLDYTTYADVRAALGVSEDELSDDTLALSLYSSNLKLELLEINSGFPALYATLKDKDPRTSDEDLLYESTRLFATYSVAKQCCASLPMFGPKEVSDSKAAMVRFSDSPYKETAKQVYKQYEANKLRVVDAYRIVAVASGTRTQRVFMAVSQPTNDPVTG